MNRKSRLSLPVAAALSASLFVAILWPNPGVFAELSSIPREETWVTDDSVGAIVTTPTTIYIGGGFTYVGPRTGCFVASDMTTGAVLAGAVPEVNGDVRACVSDGSGGWYIGGGFTEVGSETRYRLAHIMANGAVDPAWDPSSDSTVYSLARSDAAIYAGGSFTAIGGESRNGVAALDPATGAASDWNPNAWYAHWVGGGPDTYLVEEPGQVYALSVVDTILYVGGLFTSIGQQSRYSIAALDVTTGVASAWNPSPSVEWAGYPQYPSVLSLVVSGATVYAGGGFSRIGGQTRNSVAALDATTGLATAWNPRIGWDYSPYVGVLAISGTTLYVGGNFTSAGGLNRRNIVAVDAVTGLVTDWNPDPSDGYGVYSLAVSGTTVYVGGDFLNIGGQSRKRIVALDALTGLATGWNPSANDAVLCLAVTGTTVYAGGSFGSIGGQARNAVAALDAATGQLTDWNPNAGSDYPQVSVSTLVLSGTTLYAGGDFMSIGGESRNGIAALDTVTGLATGWNPNAGGFYPSEVESLAVSGSTIYASGRFTSIGGQNRNRLAALDASSGLATGWNPSPNGVNPWVHVVTVSGSTVYAGGQFESIGGQDRFNIAAIDASTGLATGWNPNANGYVRALAVSGTTVYAGGQFKSMGGVPRNYIAAIDALTGLATLWNPNAGSFVNSLTVSGATVYAGGQFGAIGGQSRNCVAALDAATGLPTAWNPGIAGLYAAVCDVAVSGATVYVGGHFKNIGGQMRQGFAQFSPPLTMVSPDGREYWELGSQHSIVWRSSNLAGEVALYLYNNWSKIRKLATVPVTDGSCTWHIPANETPQPTYRIRVQSLTNPAISDYSDKTFGIGGPRILMLTAPNGGEQWARGYAYPITWTATGALANINILLYNNWTKLRTLATISPGNGAWTWTIPSTETPLTTYRIRVQTADGALSDYGNNVFSIVSSVPTLMVTAPNDGESWQHGTAHAVTWTATYLAGDAQVWLYDNWTKLRMLGTAPVTAGTWTWNIPAGEVTGTSYRIRVVSQLNGTIGDYGNGLFAVTQ